MKWSLCVIAFRRQVLICGNWSHVEARQYKGRWPRYCCTGFCSIFVRSQSLHPLKLWLCNMHLLSNYVPALAKILYVNCTGNKNRTQSLFRDISRCCWHCKEALLPSKALWRHGLPLRVSPTTVLCRSVVTVTVATVHLRLCRLLLCTAWIIILTMWWESENRLAKLCIVWKHFTSKGHHTKPFGNVG